MNGRWVVRKVSYGAAVFVAGLVHTAAMAQSALAKRLPDLIISEARLKATGDCGLLKPLIAGVVYVKNVGKGRAQIFTTRDMVRSRVRGLPELKDDDKFVNSMRPGEVQVITVRMGVGRTFKVSGVVIVDIEVDPLNVFEEADEANNKMSVRVRLDCK
jgi:hypothetical protein